MTASLHLPSSLSLFARRNTLLNKILPGGILLAALMTAAVTAHSQGAGTADPTWTSPPTADLDASLTALQPDGKLLITGQLATDTRPAPLFVRRVTAAGIPDATFGDAGTVTALPQLWRVTPSDIKVDSAEAIVVAGIFSESDPGSGVVLPGIALIRYTSAGLPDTTFGKDGVAEFTPGAANLFNLTVRAGFIPKLALQADRKLLLLTTTLEASTTDTARHVVLMRVNADGTLDTGFGTGGAFVVRLAGSGNAYDLRIAMDGSIFFVATDGDSYGLVMKLTPTGMPDPTFGAAGKVTIQPAEAKAAARAIALQADGKIVVGGARHNAPDLTKPNGVLLLRLNPDGTLDQSFADSGYFFRDLPPGRAPYSDYITALAIEPSGKILAVADRDTRGPGVGSSVLLRFLQDGQLDPKFGVAGEYNPPGWITADLEFGDAAYLLVSDKTVSGNPRRVLKVITRTATTAPIINPGGDKVIADSDGVPGELVNLVATASDSDGTIINTRWLVDGIEVTWPERFDFQILGRVLRHSISLLLNDGSHVISFIAMDNDGAESKVSLNYEVSAPISPLPRTGSLSSTFQPSATQFAVASRDFAGTRVTSATLSHQLNLSGYIFPQTADLLTTADIFVFVETPFGWYMLDTQGRFRLWDGNHATLVPAYNARTLTETTRVPVYSGRLPWNGSYRIYLGYMRSGSNELVYAIEAGTLDIQPF